MLDPRVLALLVAAAAFRFEFATEGGLDPSWKIGLGWAHQYGFEHGRDILFTYGPLGPLGDPTLASSRVWLAASLVACGVAALAFGWVLVKAARVDRRRWPVALLAVGVGALAGLSLGLSELVAVTVALDVYARLPTSSATPPALTRMAGYGALIAATTLMKLNSGVMVAAAVGILALAWPDTAKRLMRVAVTGLACVGAGVALWFATGNGLGGVPTWLRGSYELVTSYGTSMASNRGIRWMATELMLLGMLVALLVAAQLQRMWGTGWRAHWPDGALLATMAWFLLKAGLGRFDGYHVGVPLAGLAALALGVGLSSRWRWVPVGALVLAAVGLFLSSGTGSGRPAGSLLSQRWEQPGKVWTAARSVLSGSEHRRQSAAARREIRSYYEEAGLSERLVTALDGRRVYADEWDIAALWAYDIEWQPLPVLQGFAAFSPWLDSRNADALLDADRGPEAVLSDRRTIDGRKNEWDTPSTRLAMTCAFEVAAVDDPWSVLHRAPDICGAARLIERVHAEPGESIVVPTAPEAELIVATFEIDPSLWKRAVDVLARDPHLPHVVADGTRSRYVPAAAQGMHLMKRPETFGDRDLPGGALDIRTIQFENLGGPVDATFYAVPLT